METKKLPHDHGDGMAHAIEHMPEESGFAEVSELFRQLCDGSRIKIFWLLCHCEECVINISAVMGMTSPAVSHHLRQLRGCGLIEGRRDGREVYYRAADTDMARLLHRMIEKMIEISCPSSDSCYPLRGAELARAVRDYLAANCGKRITIEELSKKFLINTSALKETFKAAYGKPIAAYMKEYRIRRAAELLRTTDMSIAAAAKQSGYETQGKFAKAFKDIFGVLPSEYKKSKTSP